MSKLIRLSNKTESKFEAVEKRIKELKPELQEMKMSKNYVVNFLIEIFLNKNFVEGDIKFISFFNKGDK